MGGYPKNFGMVLVIITMVLGACGEGAVSDLLGTEETEASKFEGVDDGTKAKFTKIESIKPNEILTLKVELFSFLSNDPLSLTNLSPLSFVPSEVGVADAPEGGLRYANGFVSRVKLLDPLSCGKFIITDLKIILCPGSMNVAFTSSQDPLVSIGTSLDSMFEIGAGAKNENEFSEIEDQVSVALSDDLEKSEKTSSEVGSETSGAPASTPVASNFVLGNKPVSHTTAEFSIMGLSSNVTARIAFAKDYFVLAYLDYDNFQRKIRIYDKNFSQGFTLLKEGTFGRSFERLDALAVSADGSRILLCGLDRRGGDQIDDVILIEIPYSRATNAFGVEKVEVITNEQLGNEHNNINARVLHAYDEGGAGYSRLIGFGGGSGGPVPTTKLFFVEGVIGSGTMHVSKSVTISNSVKSYAWNTLYKNDVPISYLGYFDDNADKSHLVSTEALKYQVVEFQTIMVEQDYGINFLRDAITDPIRSPSLSDAFYVDGTDIIAAYSANFPAEMGLARLAPSDHTAWYYAFPRIQELAVSSMAYDTADTGNVLSVLLRPSYDGQPAYLKVSGFTLSY